MSRPRNTTRSIDVHLMLPEDLVAEVSIMLYSDLQGRIPLGEQARFYTRAARELLQRMKEETDSVQNSSR